MRIRTFQSTAIISSIFLSSSIALAQSTEKPEPRANECLATFDKVETSLEVLSMPEYLKRYYQQELREHNAYSFRSKEEIQKDLEAAPHQEHVYELFRWGYSPKNLVIELRSPQGGYIGVPVDLSKKENITVSHFWEDRERWDVIEVEWKGEMFSIKDNMIGMSEEKPDYVFEGTKWIGKIECPDPK